MALEFQFACTVCGARMRMADATSQICLEGGHRFRKVDGVWRFLPAERTAALDRFIREYETVRTAEGRGTVDPAFYRQLPVTSPSYHRAGEWLERARSFQSLLKVVIAPLEGSGPLRVLDLGSGNGWLSHQLAKRGHCVAAVDLSLSDLDGLGTHSHYDTAFTPVQAEFDLLPFSDNQADLALFNASFHYSEAALETAAEAWRVTRRGGRLVIVDSPVYHERSSGDQMVQERQDDFRVRYGFPSDALRSEHFLTYERVAQISDGLGAPAQVVWPLPRWRRAVRRGRVWLRRQREPAQFPILIWQKVRR